MQGWVKGVDRCMRVDGVMHVQRLGAMIVLGYHARPARLIPLLESSTDIVIAR